MVYLATCGLMYCRPLYQLVDFWGWTSADAEPYVAMRRQIGLEDAGKEVRADRGGSADEQLAALAGAELLDSLAPLGHLRQHALCVGEERAAGIGEGHPARAAHEQFDLEIALEALQPGRERGLGEVQDLGRPADVAEPRRLRECLQLR